MRSVLRRVLDETRPLAGDVQYRVVGTVAALLHGIRLPVGDLDLLFADRAGLDSWATALAKHPCSHPPEWIAESMQYFARFEIGEARIELSTVESDVGDAQFECAGRAPWEQFVRVPIGAHSVPTVRLELRLATELRRGRMDRAIPILGHLRRHGFDRDLLGRALGDAAVPDDLARFALT